MQGQSARCELNAMASTVATRHITAKARPSEPVRKSSSRYSLSSLRVWMKCYWSTGRSKLRLVTFSDTNSRLVPPGACVQSVLAQLQCSFAQGHSKSPSCTDQLVGLANELDHPPPPKKKNPPIAPSNYSAGEGQPHHQEASPKDRKVDNVSRAPMTTCSRLRY